MTTRSTATRARMIAAGNQLLATSGADAITVRSVCELSGTSVSSFYHQFGKRETFLRELVLGIRASTEARGRAAIESRGHKRSELRETLRIAIREFVRLCASERDLYAQVAAVERTKPEVERERLAQDASTVDATAEWMADEAKLDGAQLLSLRRVVRLITVGVRRGHSGVDRFLERMDLPVDAIVDELVEIAVALVGIEHPAPLVSPILSAMPKISSESTTRGIILTAAEAVLSRRDASELTINDVAAEAHVAPSSIYHYFDGKSQLLEAVVDDIERTTFSFALEMAQEIDLDALSVNQQIEAGLAIFFRAIATRGHVLLALEHSSELSPQVVDAIVRSSTGGVEVAFALVQSMYKTEFQGCEKDTPQRIRLLLYFVSCVIHHAGWGPVSFLDSIDLTMPELLSMFAQLIAQRAEHLVHA